MADKTTDELITATRAAIHAVLTGAQSYSMDGRTYTRANIGLLMTTLKDLLKLKQIEDGTRTTISAVDFSGMGYS